MAEAGHDFCAPRAAMVHGHPGIHSCPEAALHTPQAQRSGRHPWQHTDAKAGRRERALAGGDEAADAKQGAGGAPWGRVWSLALGPGPLWFLGATRPPPGPLEAKAASPPCGQRRRDSRAALSPPGSVCFPSRYCCWSMKGQNHLESSEFPALLEFLIENLLFWRTVTSPGLRHPGRGQAGGALAPGNTVMAPEPLE